MLYSANEKQRMNKLVNAFRDFIREQSYFDIVYSEKIGYLRIIIQEKDDDTVIRLSSFDEMLETLIDDVFMEEKLPDDGMDQEKVRRKLLKNFDRLGEEAAFCTTVMERQLADWRA